MKGKPKCSQRIRPRGAGMAFSSGHTCDRNGAIQRDGKWYCGQHDPEAVAARNKALNAKWEAKWAAQEAAEKHSQSIERARDKVIAAARRVRKSVTAFPNLDTLYAAVDRLEKLEGQPA